MDGGREYAYYSIARSVARDQFGHWIGLCGLEADYFVDWLLNESGFNPYEIIDELEYQIKQTDADYFFIERCSEALKTIPVCCDLCRRIIPYGSANIMNRYKTDNYSEVISRSLVGGSTVRRHTSMTYISGRDYICDSCMAIVKQNIPTKRKNTGIKNILKKLIGIFTRHK